MTDTVRPSLTGQQKNMIFENMSDGIITVDEQGTITYLNSACAEILHTPKEDLLEHSFEETLLSCKKNKAFNRLFQNSIHKAVTPDKKTVRYQTEQGTRYFTIDISLIASEQQDSRKKTFQGMMILIEDVTDAYQLKQHERDCAYIFAGIIMCISIYLSAWSLIQFTLKIPLKTSSYTLMIEGMTLILFLEIVFLTSFSMRDIGLVPRRSTLSKVLKETMLIALIACGALFAAKVILTLFGIPIKDRFIGGSLHGAYTYLFTAFIQEFLARGVIQTSVKYLMHVKYQKQFGIFLTSLLFSLMHLPFGFVFMMGAFALSIALGYLFERQETLWGCAFLHWSVGYIAMCLYF